MILLELFDTDVKSTVADATDDVYSETAHIGSRRIIFICNKGDDQPHASWEVAFYKRLKGGSLYDVTTKKTGSGSAIQVFSFVKAALARFIERYSPNSFYFSAARNEPSRISLYGMLAKKFKHPDYTVKSHSMYGDTYWSYQAIKK